MAIALVDSDNLREYNSGDIVLTLEGVSVGDLIVVFGISDDQTSSTVTGVSDDDSNDYTLRDAVTNNGTVYIRSAYCLSASGSGTVTVTIGFDDAADNHIGYALCFHPDADEVVTLVDSASVVTGWAAAGTIQTGQFSISAGDNVAVDAHECSNGSKHINEEIPSGEAATAIDDQNYHVCFYRIFSDAITDGVAEADSGGAGYNAAEVLAFQSNPGAGGSTVPLMMQYYRRLRA